jgi:hypothetical protein
MLSIKSLNQPGYLQFNAGAQLKAPGDTRSVAQQDRFEPVHVRRPIRTAITSDRVWLC